MCHISDRSKRKGVNSLNEIEIIYQKYYKFVKGYAFTLCFDESLAEDITQETFFKAIKESDNTIAILADNLQGFQKLEIETWFDEVVKYENEVLLKR